MKTIRIIAVIAICSTFLTGCIADEEFEEMENIELQRPATEGDDDHREKPGGNS